MPAKKYWVVGGEYTNSNFESLKEGTGTIAGPFYAREEALEEWKRLSGSASRALVRYTIAEEPVRV